MDTTSLPSEDRDIMKKDLKMLNRSGTEGDGSGAGRNAQNLLAT
jgi:hypothetical protein